MWAIYTVDADGAARVEEVYASELDALRANKNNVDPKRKVRFLPYGIAVSVLDDSEELYRFSQPCCTTFPAPDLVIFGEPV